MDEQARKEMAARRLNICRGCTLKQNLPLIGMVCGTLAVPVKGKTCGCIIKFAVRFPQHDCPSGYWPK